MIRIWKVFGGSISFKDDRSICKISEIYNHFLTHTTAPHKGSILRPCTTNIMKLSPFQLIQFKNRNESPNIIWKRPNWSKLWNIQQSSFHSSHLSQWEAFFRPKVFKMKMYFDYRINSRGWSPMAFMNRFYDSWLSMP